MFIRFWIFVIVSFGVVAGGLAQGTSPRTTTTCEEFERDIKFDSLSIVDSMWKIIYFWSEKTEIRPIIFSLIEKKRLSRFKAVMDAIAPELEVEWRRAILMMEPRPGVQVILLHATTPGAFRALVKMEQRDKVRPNPEPLLKFADLRFKLVGRYLGMMCCEDLTAFVMARVDEMPTTDEECLVAANNLGLHGPGGRSYLYFNKTRTEL